jgi:hypothetical protein
MLSMPMQDLPTPESYNHSQSLQNALNEIVDGMKNKFSEARD